MTSCMPFQNRTIIRAIRLHVRNQSVPNQNTILASARLKRRPILLLQFRIRHIKAPEQLPRLVPARKLEFHMDIHPPRSAERRIERMILICRGEQKSSFLGSPTVKRVEQSPDRDSRRE